MATIDSLQLRIDVDAVGPNPRATLMVSYTAHWDAYDRASRQAYQQEWVIWGGDAGPGEDGEDDRITGSGALDDTQVSSDGSASSQHELELVIDLPDLDEDPGSALDEIKVEVKLVPMTPRTVSETTNRVLVNA